METKYGSLVDAKEGIICHGVNCMGKMGAGAALAIRKKFPTVYSRFLSTGIGVDLLGQLDVVRIDHRLYVANMYNQVYYGYRTPYKGTCHFDYDAFRSALHLLYSWNRAFKASAGDYLTIHMPYKIGCNLAGGNWLEVEKILLDWENTCGQHIILWRTTDDPY